MIAEFGNDDVRHQACDRPGPRNPHHCFHPASGLRPASYLPASGRFQQD
jgi:hypothetical protein